MIEVDLGHGFKLWPVEGVTLNGMPLSQLNTREDPDYKGPWNLIAPNNRAVDGEGGRPYYYRTTEEAIEDFEFLYGFGECSTCGGIWTKEDTVSVKTEELREALSKIFNNVGDIWGDSEWVKIKIGDLLLCVRHSDLVNTLLLSVSEST